MPAAASGRVVDGSRKAQTFAAQYIIEIKHIVLIVTDLPCRLLDRIPLILKWRCRTMTTKSEDQLKSTACAIAFLRCTFACFKDPALRYDPRTLNFEGKILKLLPGMFSFTGLPQSLEGCRKLARQLEQGTTKFENGMEDHWGGISLNCARCKVVDEVIGKWAQNLGVINNATIAFFT